MQNTYLSNLTKLPVLLYVPFNIDNTTVSLIRHKISKLEYKGLHRVMNID